MDVKEKINKLRMERHWSLYRLAKEAGISQNAVYNWYNGNNYTPSRDKIEDVCAAFGVSLSEFFADVEVDKLTDKEIRLLELFRKVPDKKKIAVITVIESFIE